MRYFEGLDKEEGQIIKKIKQNKKIRNWLSALFIIIILSPILLSYLSNYQKEIFSLSKNIIFLIVLGSLICFIIPRTR